MAITPGDLKRISDLWDVLAELPAGEREQWLCAVGADDAPHVPALRDMLRGRDGPADGLSLGVPSFAGDLQPSPAGIHQPGDQVGPFRLLRFLGRGGMAEVWLARRDDGPMVREVALKLPLTLAKHRMLRQRFDRECAILSALSHPHIARLYDAGVSTDGQPFMALEYVKGEPVPAYCDARVLPVSARVGLMLQLLGAVHHAHTQLVIHRDIKPANIMVTGDGTVRLLDFGIAKLLSEDELATGQAATALTHMGGSALTLDYASPEQVLQQPVGTASDVYSLGVVLFELLCGARPYALRRNDRRALEAAILAEERPSPSSCVASAAAAARGVSARSLQRLLRGDLDTIVAKALRVHAADRYASVAAFSDDLQRWLRHEPILARPVSASYRTWRFTQRHWVALTAAVAVASALIAGTAVSMQQAQRALVQERLARQEATRAQMVSKFMEDVFSANGRGGKDVKAARQRTARELLDRGVDRLAADQVVTAEVRIDLLATFGTIYREMGLLGRCVALGRQRAELARVAFGEGSLPYADALIDVAWGLSVMGLAPEAVAAAQPARAALKLIPGTSEALATAWVRYAGVVADAGARGNLALGLTAIAEGQVWMARSQNLAAKSFFQMNLGILRLQERRLRDGLDELRRAMALHDGLGPDQRAKSFGIESWLGAAELYNGNVDAARFYIESAIKSVEGTEVAAEEQWVYQGLWRWFEVTGNLEDAFRTADKAVSKLNQLPASDFTPGMAGPFLTHSQAAWRSGRISQALASLDRAEAIWAQGGKSVPAPKPGNSQALRYVEPTFWVGAFLAAGRMDEATDMLEMQRRTLAEHGQVFSFRTLDYHLSSIELGLKTQDRQRARDSLDEILKQQLNPESARFYDLWRLEVLQARTWALEGQMQQAEAKLRDFLKTIEARNDAHHWSDHVARARFALGEVLMATGRANEARPELRLAAAVFRKTQVAELSLDLARSLEALARADAAAKDVDSSRIHQAQAKAIWARHPSLSPSIRVAVK